MCYVMISFLWFIIYGLGMIAAAWTAMVAMGQEGYMNIAKEVLGVTKKIIDAVDRTKGIRLVTRPDMTSLAIMSDDPKVNILALADVMEEKGWQMERQQNPDSLHVSQFSNVYFYLRLFCSDSVIYVVV